MKTAFILVCVVLMLAVLAGCAPGPNELLNSRAPNGSAAGFWMGLWNGLIAPITFVISLFTKNVQMYEVHNNGGWYNFGFLLGAAAVLGGGGGGAASRRSRK